MGTSYSDHDAWTVPPSWVPLIHDLPQRCESEIGLHCLADSWNLMTGYGDFFLQTSLIFGWRLPRTCLRCSFTNSWTCLGYVEPPDIFQLVAVVDCVWKDPLNISQETVDRCEPFAPNKWFPPQLGQHEHTILVVCGLSPVFGKLH